MTNYPKNSISRPYTNCMQAESTLSTDLTQVSSVRVPVRNFGLDALRAIAISLVLCSHFYKPLNILGDYGVELFFALSGFLIGGILLKSLHNFNRRALINFWTRRWFRTLPNYYWFLLLYLLFWPPVLEPRLLAYLVFLQNFAWPIMPFAGHTWSLAVEEWFYLLFPLMLLVLTRSARTRPMVMSRFLFTTMLFLVVPALLRFTEPLWIGQPDPRMIVICRLDAIMYGVLFAYLKALGTNWQRLRGAWPLGVLGLAMSALLVARHNYYLQATAFTIIPPSFAFLIPRVEQCKRVAAPLAAAIENLSIWSYSIYLCHMLVYFSIMRLVGYTRFGFALQFGTKVVSLLLAVGLSALNYKYFESPMTNLRERFCG